MGLGAPGGIYALRRARRTFTMCTDFLFDHARTLLPGGGALLKERFGRAHPTPKLKDVYKLLGVRGPTPKDVYTLLGHCLRGEIWEF